MNQAPRFETEIQPLFRERDRESMIRAFDLWWPAERVELFRSWAENGKPANPGNASDRR